MIQISEKDKERIRNGELARAVVTPEYFREGDYTNWQEQSEETKSIPYDMFVDWLVKYMEKYDSIVVYSDGTIYGNKGGLSHDIEYDAFDDVETFIELIEKYGVGEIEFS